MQFFMGFMIGLGAGWLAMYLVARNNRKHIADALDLPEKLLVKAGEEKAEILSRLGGNAVSKDTSKVDGCPVCNDRRERGFDIWHCRYHGWVERRR